MTPVLDASAVLALLHKEPGHDEVAALLDGAVVSAVNWAEVRHKLTQRGIDPSLADTVRVLGVQVRPFGLDDAERAAALWPVTRAHGLSLGDRACLAVTQGISGAEAFTADKAWAELDTEIEIRLIR